MDAIDLQREIDRLTRAGKIAEGVQLGIEDRYVVEEQNGKQIVTLRLFLEHIARSEGKRLKAVSFQSVFGPNPERVPGVPYVLKPEFENR